MFAAEAYDVCRQYMNRNVRVQTTSGHVYDGRIVHVDDANVYLSMPAQAMHGAGTAGGDCGCGCGGAGKTRQFYPYAFGNPYYFNDVILPLSLFTLLAIALI